MNNLIEIHVLQNYAPSNLNRDDTGAPKDALFGGVRRARISSQCIKRAIRLHFQDQQRQGLFSEDDLAVRTKRVVGAVQELLSDRYSEEEILAKTKLALSYIKLKLKEDQKTKYLLYLGRQEIQQLAETIAEHWDAIAISDTDKKPKKGGKKSGKKKGEADPPKEVTARLQKLLDGGKAVDLALFGRMLADLPQKNQDAACQVAHAISTHAVEREFDFYTAVDDLKPSDNAGADMMGTVEFNSACFYRYAAIDWDKLVENLHGDRQLAGKGVRTFLEGFVISEPTGKQNSFAAHNPPEFVAISLRQNTAPRNLANAFEVPIWTPKGKSLTGRSVEELVNKAGQLFKAYGGTTVRSLVLNLTKADASKMGESVDSLEDLLTKLDLPKE